MGVVVTSTLVDMPRPSRKPTSKGEKARPPSREKISYTAIPKVYAQLLDAMTADGEKYEKRSVSYLTTVAVRAFLRAEGKVDEKGKPLG